MPGDKGYNQEDAERQAKEKKADKKKVEENKVEENKVEEKKKKVTEAEAEAKNVTLAAKQDGVNTRNEHLAEEDHLKGVIQQKKVEKVDSKQELHDMKLKLKHVDMKLEEQEQQHQKELADREAQLKKQSHMEQLQMKKNLHADHLETVRSLRETTMDASAKRSITVGASCLLRWNRVLVLPEQSDSQLKHLVSMHVYSMIFSSDC